MAALGELLKKRIRAQASCAVCENFYSDPVQLRCGTSFCRACVAELSPPVCPDPDCDAEFDPARLASNPSLARLVEIAQQLLEQEERREASALGGAADGEPPRGPAVFCKDEKSLICSSCYVPEEHPGHDVVPADEAAQEYRAHMRRCLVHLKREEQDILMNQTILAVDCEFYYTRATLVWEKAKTEFHRMEDFLEEQKKWLLAQVTEVYKEIQINKNKQLSALSKKQSLLQHVSNEIEEAIHLSGSELLENIGGVLQRFEEREPVEPRGSLCFELQDKISGLVNYHTFLTGAMQHFRENMTHGFSRHRGIPTPSPNGMEVDTSEEPQAVAQPSDPDSSSLQAE
ncbi:UNVERIFIED_CONTAM: hypothetical protein K2H54_061095 [Gekko kuhli]